MCLNYSTYCIQFKGWLLIFFNTGVYWLLTNFHSSVKPFFETKIVTYIIHQVTILVRKSWGLESRDGYVALYTRENISFKMTYQFFVRGI